MQNNSVAIIERVINRLRQLVRFEVQPSWRDLTLLSIVNLSHSLAQIDLQQCPTATVNERGYIVFPQGKQTKWLARKIVIPQTLRGYPLSGLSLRLVLTWWAEDAQIFINGELVQQGDLFDSSARVLITDDALPQQEYLVTIGLVSPDHDIGALMRSHLLYESSSSALDPGWVADELTVLSKYLTQFEPDRLEVLATALDKFNWNNLENADRFGDDLAKLRSSLLPLAGNIKSRCFNLLGHAHLDMAWLWTTDETYEVAERTFKSVLSLRQDFPALTFGHTSPALYQWLEDNRPELFQQIRQAIAANKWEILGGMWIEPETNLVSGESLIRQLLYGQQYYQKKFGEVSKVAWLPDSFGFTWQLPQIMQQCGIEYFVTGKLHWNDTTQFPHGCFWWESPDGTRMLTLMSPPNVTGVMDTNPITMTDYAVGWEQQTGLQEIFWLPGVGDHGGGPTRDMLEVAAKWSSSPFFPEIKFSTALDYLNKISQSPSPPVPDAIADAPANPLGNPLGQSPSHPFPVWQDELYLELHRGCYTVHADQKRYNRYGERLLYEAELWSTLATLLCGDRFVSQPLFSNISTILEKADFCQAPQQLIETAWKKVLFNQFHDILPGTSIPEVFTAANRDWQAAIAIGEHLLQQSLAAIASSITLPEPPQPDAKPIVIFNSLNWSRSQVVTLVNTNNNCVYDDLSREIIAESESNSLTFFAQNVPAVGYRLYWITHQTAFVKTTTKVNFKSNFKLENQYLKVAIDPQTGDIESIYNELQRREILRKPGDKLEAFTDAGQYWDAWNIDPEYEQKQLPAAKLSSIQIIENNRLRQTVRVTKQFNNSQLVRDYILEYASPVLKIANKVDWQETHVMLKTAFPLKLESDRVTYEIPCGTTSRTTKPQTAAERAKWEVPALNWVDLTDNSGKYGVSLLSDCKHGYDIQPNRLRLTLLRSPEWPDPQSDKGIHHFTYALYPHQQDWKSANTVQKAYELNTPLQTVAVSCDGDRVTDGLPSEGELLNLSADNLILMALKLSESGIIMRCYEAHGESAQLELQGDLDLQLDFACDCLEANTEEMRSTKIEPYKIKTFKLRRS